MDQLISRLSLGAFVDSPDEMEAYRRDKADLVLAGRPLGVVKAAGVSDVVETLRWASANRVAVVPRGAGTGLAGGSTATNGCIVLSLAAMTSIREINKNGQYATVEAGVITADLDRKARRVGLFYPPDPGSFEISTLGGNIATNAGGMHCVKYGVTRNSVLSLEVVLPNGNLLNTGRRTVKSVAGYDLTSLFVGSEGTLGVITAATLKLNPLPASKPVTFTADFPSLESLGRAVVSIRKSGCQPSVLELLDRVAIGLIEDYRSMGLNRGSTALLIGQSDGLHTEYEIELMLDLCKQSGAIAVDRYIGPEGDRLIEARRLIGIAALIKGETIIEDIVVPPEEIDSMLSEIDRISSEHELFITTVGHVGDGNLHPIIIIPDEAARPHANKVAELIWRAALCRNGSITGEHGIGLLKRSWLKAELDSISLGVHQAIKSALDPNDIMNPGKGF